MASSDPSTVSVPLRGADCFVLALNRMMRRHGQLGLVGQTHLELSGLPDLDALRRTANELVRRHPLLTARTTRNPFTWKAAWRVSKCEGKTMPVGLWREERVAPVPGEHFQPVSDAASCATDILNSPLPDLPVHGNLRLDLVLRESAGPLLLVTWSHLLFDGKGAEMLVTELATILHNRTPDPGPVAREPSRPLKERFDHGKAVVERFYEMSRVGFRSLGGPRPRPGRLRFLVKTFSREETAAIRGRAESLTGPLFNLAYYLACATRAHREVFLSRGEDPVQYVVSVPVQVRRKGSSPSMFQNRVSILFFAIKRDDLFSLDTAARAIHLQFATMTRERLGESFDSVLGLMRRLPAPFYTAFVRLQFCGEVTSFFHSYTGSFSPPPPPLFGATIDNAYHIPSVSNPPGSGLFFGEFDGRLSFTFSWRDGCVDSSEREILIARLDQDLSADADQPSAQTLAEQA